MTDSYSLKVMSLFEAGARLECSAETLSLAAHIYHRFFKAKPELWNYDLYLFAAASIKLAHWFYELPVKSDNIARAMISVIHGPRVHIETDIMEKSVRSIDLTVELISNTLSFELDYREKRMLTPGDLQRRRIRLEEEEKLVKAMAAEYSDDEDNETFEEKLLLRNSNSSISSHRYLVHYLNTIKLLVSEKDIEHFVKISNIAWTFLSDFHWSPRVTRHLSKHLACACLMMAIEAYRKKLRLTSHLWSLLNKKWNLIFCDDLNNVHLEATIESIVGQYAEYERVFQHEFSTYVIDPSKT